MTDKQREAILLSAVIMLGAGVRLSAPLAADFPLNDGGLFYQMILDLQQNKFILPVYTSYNFASIPYAYPPLAFYLYGIINLISGVPLLKLMQYLPALVSIGTIPAFYPLAKNILGDVRTALWATTVFALTPRTFDWLIMGGGATRSLGFLFALLAMQQTHALFANPARRNVILTIILGGAVVVTHPEASIHTFIAAVFFYLWKDRTLKGFLRALNIALGVLGISSIWWAVILIQHGFSPFQAAMIAAKENSAGLLLRVFALLKFDFTDEPFIQAISVLGLLGLFILLAQRKPTLPIWFTTIALLEPRGGGLYMMTPLSMFAGVAIDQVIMPALNEKERASYSLPGKIFAGFITLYAVINASAAAANISQRLTLTTADLNAFAWIKSNTPPDSNFIVVTKGLPLNDSTAEWFPVFAERRSNATIFGYEWVDDGQFAQRVHFYEEIQKCAEEGLDCLESQRHTEDYSFIYIREARPSLLLTQLELSSNYKLFYQEGQITVFQKNSQ